MPRRYVFRILLAAITLVAVGLVAKRILPNPAPPTGLAPELENGLLSGNVGTLPTNVSILGAVFTVPSTAGAYSDLLLKRINSSRSPQALFGTFPPNPPAILKEQGLYLAVLSWNGKYLDILKMNNPWGVRGEAFTPISGSAVLLSARDNALAARIPFVPFGRLVLFEVGPGKHITRVVFSFRFDFLTPTSGGARYRLGTS